MKLFTVVALLMTTLSSQAFASDFFDANADLKSIVLKDLVNIQSELQSSSNMKVFIDEASLTCTGVNSEKFGVVGTCGLHVGTDSAWDFMAAINVLKTSSDGKVVERTLKLVQTHED
jgi:hypothetical protein